MDDSIPFEKVFLYIYIYIYKKTWWHCWFVPYYIFLFLMRLSDLLWLSANMNIFQIHLFDMFDMFGNMSQKCEQFSYELLCLVILFCFFLFFWEGVLNGPPPIPSVSVKVPFWGGGICFDKKKEEGVSCLLLNLFNKYFVV